jgi:hypothetical protein
MDKKGFSLLVSAGVVQKVVFVRDVKSGTGWSVAIYQDEDAEPARWNGASIRTSRGEVREFKTLESALAFVRACGYTRHISIDELFPLSV